MVAALLSHCYRAQCYEVLYVPTEGTYEVKANLVSILLLVTIKLHIREGFLVAFVVERYQSRTKVTKRLIMYTKHINHIYYL